MKCFTLTVTEIFEKEIDIEADCHVESRKVYGLVSHTMLEVEEISQIAEMVTQTEQPSLFTELSGISQSSINSEGIDNG